MEEEKNTTDVVGIRIKMETNGTKYDIKFIEEIECIVNLFQNGTTYTSMICENINVTSKINFYEFYGDNIY